MMINVWTDGSGEKKETVHFPRSFVRSFPTPPTLNPLLVVVLRAFRKKKKRLAYLWKCEGRGRAKRRKKKKKSTLPIPLAISRLFFPPLF